MEGCACAHGGEPLDHARAHGDARREQGKEFCGPTLAGMGAKRREIGGRGFFGRGVLAGLPEFCGVFSGFAEFPRPCGSAITGGLSPLCAHRKSGDFGFAFQRARVLRSIDVFARHDGVRATFMGTEVAIGGTQYPAHTH